MKIIKILSFILLILFGAFMVVFGEHDDSPGAQGLGVIGAIIGLIGIYKQIKKK
jgi:drug/metabolite transporter (DMT)-like permease